MPSARLLRRLSMVPVAGAIAAATLVATPTSASAVPAHVANDREVNRAVKIAVNQIGDPYSYGATGPNSFDCSGLTSFAYAAAGVRINRTSDGQYAQSRKIPRGALKRGDLMFVHSGGNVYHVGMFWGRKGGQTYMLHSPRTGENVQISPVWTNSWMAGTMRPKHQRTPLLSGGGSPAGSR